MANRCLQVMSMTQAWTHTCKAVNVSVQAQAMTDSGHDGLQSHNLSNAGSLAMELADSGRLWLKMVLLQPDNASLTAHLHVQVQALSSTHQACRPSGLQSRGSDAMPHKHDNAYKKRQLCRQNKNLDKELSKVRKTLADTADKLEDVQASLDVAGVLSCHQCD